MSSLNYTHLGQSTKNLTRNQGKRKVTEKNLSKSKISLTFYNLLKGSGLELPEVSYFDSNKVDLINGKTNKDIIMEQEYNTTFHGSVQEAQDTMVKISCFFLELIYEDYRKKFNARNLEPLKLAIALEPFKMLIWAEIGDDDDQLKGDLIMLGAEVAARHYQYNVQLQTLVLKKGYEVGIPHNYQQVS